MAQAPQGPTGAPRQNKTVKEFKGMNTQNRRNAIPEGSFAWLENIQPIGPGHLHSIPGRSTAVVRIPPEEPPPPGCTDATERGQQIVSIEDRFVQTGTYLGSCTFGGERTSWAYISPMEEVYTLLGCAGCGGGNMNYDTCTQINHWQSPSVLVNPALINPDSDPSFMRMGTSDEPIYMPKNTAYYPNSNTSVSYVIPAGLTLDSTDVTFAKRDTSIYLVAHDQIFPNFFKHILEYSATGGTLLNDFDLGEQFSISQMALTASFIYVLGAVVGSENFPEIRKYARSDGTLTDTFFIDNLQPNCIGLVSDDLIYILGSGDRATLYYLKNFTDLVYVGYTGAQGFSPFFPSSGLFVNGAFYYGSSGAGGFSTDIFKVSVACPEGSPATPLFASLDRGSASVAAGGTITVSWADIVVPNAADSILLYDAPPAGKLGFAIGGQLAGQFATGAGTDSIVFTIPLATPPGDYIFIYSGPGSDIYIAASPVFAVT